MITKTGQKLVKRGSLTAAAVGGFLAKGALAHVGQNAGMRWALDNLEKSRLLNVIVRAIGKPGQGMSTVPGNAAYGVATGIAPEIGMLEEKLSKTVGKPLENILKSQNIDINKLPRRHSVALSLAAQGRFRDAYRVANTPESRQTLNSVMEKFYPHIDAVADNFPMVKGKTGLLADAIKRSQIRVGIDQNQFNTILSGLEEQYKAHPLTGQIAEAFQGTKAKKISDMLKGDDNVIKRFARKGANVATRAVLAPVEPAAAALNEGKRWLDWELMQNIPAAKKVQDWATHRYVDKPLKEFFEDGLTGNKRTQFLGLKSSLEDIRRTKQLHGLEEARKLKHEYWEDAKDAYGFNAFTNMTNHMANQFGLALNRAGITSTEQLSHMKNQANKLKSMWENHRYKGKTLETAARPVPSALPPGPIQAAVSKPATKTTTIFLNQPLDYKSFASGSSLFSVKA